MDCAGKKMAVHGNPMFHAMGLVQLSIPVGNLSFIRRTLSHVVIKGNLRACTVNFQASVTRRDADPGLNDESRQGD